MWSVSRHFFASTECNYDECRYLDVQATVSNHTKLTSSSNVKITDISLIEFITFELIPRLDCARF